MIRRDEKLLGCVDLARHEGIEIRPLDRPVVRPNAGRMFYGDFDTLEGLKVRYSSDPNIQTENMVRIDYVLDPVGLPESVATRRFHFVIANHVLEHVPDMIGFLNGVTQMLWPNGVICLAIADKRYMSDYFRNTTALADVVDAHLGKLSRPSIRQAFDQFANAAEIPVLGAWNGTLHKEHLRRAYTLPEAMKMARLAESDRYLTCRCNVFTPESFFEVLRGCFELGLLRVEVARFWATCPTEQEFFVIFRRLSDKLDKSVRIRIQLDSLPPTDIIAQSLDAGWEPRDAGFLAASRSGGFDQKVFYIQSGLRYWVVSEEWGRAAGFCWPEDIRRLSDEEITNYAYVPEQPPPPAVVRLSSAGKAAGDG